MLTLTKFVPTVFLLVTIGHPAFAQIDRARDAPFADFTRNYGETIKYAEKGDRDSALEASNDMAKALNAIFDFSKNIPSKLNDAKLSKLASKAQDFLRTIKDFRDKGSRLQDKLKSVGSDYKSEVSALKSEYRDLKDDFNDLWRSFQVTGKQVNRMYEAIKTTCMRGCLR